ncbi:hypothetical protein LOTGIDRAFT_239217 [Lottia gigantea]|uniref:Complement Clr-like EGF domain-containing protein n=1 Tax=Lottia gigantea TaxID=225164 RepID=V4AQI3_LOTGI|nr:hypothetical protein LOTGIDRAFT_239217 [Lottia gigantea]ESO97080.1 hypothetical protein LOTGIDRAFT_239217 [Lottia gigantea]
MNFKSGLLVAAAVIVMANGQVVPGVCDTVICINGFCSVNALNQAVCQCEPGYKPSGTPQICVDIDECVEYDTLCNNQAGCCNFLGTYACLPCSAFTNKQARIPNSLLRRISDRK